MHGATLRSVATSPSTAGRLRGVKIFGGERGEGPNSGGDEPVARTAEPNLFDKAVDAKPSVDNVLADLTSELLPVQVSQDRLRAWLEEAGFAYFTDSDGDLGGIWHNRIFYLLALGTNCEVLQVRGQWHREASLDHLGAVLEVCNTWNGERIWPKSYVRVRDDGTVVVCTDLTIDVEHGATDAQLDLMLRCGLATGTAFFDRLDEEFPDPLNPTRG